VERELASGALVELLPQHGGCSRPFYLIYPHARHLSLRVRSFVDFVLR
jgi:DNA-binding transcriptional LysR family regulator